MTEGKPDEKIIFAKTSSQKNDKGTQPKLTRNKMNPLLLLNCIPIILFLSILPTYLTKLQSKSINQVNSTSHALTKHYYFFENQMAPLKIYVYNKSEPDQHEHIVQMFGSNPPRSDRFSRQAEEIIFCRTLQNSQNSFLLEKDPEKADLFYGPFCFSISAMMIRSSNKRDFYQYYLPLLRSMGPYFDRYDGLDHVMVQMSPAYHIRAPISSNNVRTLAFMATMSDIPYGLPDRELWHFTEFFHGSNAPLYVDDVENDTIAIDASSNPHKRTNFLFFQGVLNLFWNAHGSTIRHSLAAQMSDIPGTFSLYIQSGDSSAEALEANMYETMRKSQICLQAVQDSPTYRSMTDSFLSYCVPLVFSDQAFFPFEDVFIDYKQIVIQVPMESTDLLKSTINKANYRKIKQARILMREVGHLWEDSKQYTIEKRSSFWAWMWMQFFQNSIIVASKRRYPNLLGEPTFEE